MKRIRHPFLFAHDDESGIAMIMVIGIGVVLTLMVTAGLAISLSGVVKGKTDQNWNAAMSAAYAGIEEYESRLSNDNTYQQYGNPASAFSSTSSVTLPTGSLENPAFGTGTSGSWATVPGSGRTSSFRYEVDNSAYGATGVLRLRSTGKVGDSTRSIVANLKQQGFIDFLYFTDYEIQDPDISGASISSCVKYAWAGRPSSGCSEIAFGGGDAINGPMHSNDTVRICDATFNGKVTTAYNPPTGNLYATKDSNGNNCGGQVFTAGKPVYSPVVGMPPTNTQMKKEVRSDLSADVPRPGCLYTGPTKIVFNSDGTMTVRSPWTKATNVAGSPATSGTTPARCGAVGTSSGQLGSSAGARITVPPKNLIYVQNVPSVSTDPNYWASSDYPSGTDCSKPRRSSVVSCDGASGSSGDGNGIGYPTSGEAAPSSTSYGYRNGDVFVEGTMKGQATLAAENYVYVTDDIIYADANDDVLGLVGNNAVWVWNPMSSWGNSVLGNHGRTIDAAILSVAHTFQVQNYGSGGERGALNVYGAIAQKFRGIVHSGNNGYTKNYVYDQRLRYTAPPKFLSPVSTSYGISTIVEVKTAMKPDGSEILP